MTTIVRKMKLSGWKYQASFEHMVEIEIDDERFAGYLAEKAFRNRSKKSKLQGGMVKCSIYPTEQGAVALKAYQAEKAAKLPGSVT